MATLIISGKEVFVDDEDWGKVAELPWCICRSQFCEYAGTYLNGECVQMHRLLMPHLKMIDHKDGNGLNNRRSNLRECTPAQNQWNSRKLRKNLTSRYKGVWRARRKNSPNATYEVALRCNNKRYFIGYFKCEITAALAYDVASFVLHGEFSRPNFPLKESSVRFPSELKIAIERCRTKGIVPETVEKWILDQEKLVGLK